MIRLSRLAVVLLGLVALLLFGLQAVPPVNAATIEKLFVSCSFVAVSGKTEVAAPSVRVQVALASNLTTILANTVVPTSPQKGAKYQAFLSIAASHVPEGTLLVISAGEWNGVRYLRPATLTSRYCGMSATPTPPPVSSPAVSQTPPPTPTPPPISSPTRTAFPPPTPVPTQSVSQTPPPTPTRH